MQEDLLKDKMDEIANLKNALSKEKMKVDELTKESSLVKDTNVVLEKDKVELQESLEILQASHIALEVIKNNSSNSNDASSPSSASTSNGCARCYKFDLNACETNLAERNTMKKEIARLSSMLLKEQSSKRGEFENHTKGFGSSYMKKFGFADGKGLGKNEQGSKDPIPFVKNNHTIGMGAKKVVHGMAQLHQAYQVQQCS